MRLRLPDVPVKVEGLQVGTGGASHFVTSFLFDIIEFFLNLR
jgi:hypothetical protein